MKKKYYIILMLVFLLNCMGCETKTVAVEPDEEAIKTTIPFNQRKFIYNNNIKIDYKEDISTDNTKVKVTNYYSIISGLKNKSVQDKINKELEEFPKKLLSILEASFISTGKLDTLIYEQKRINSNIFYNYNNIIFVSYGASIDAKLNNDYYYPNFKNTTYGYDLNTGEKIILADVFKPGIDFKTKINNFICQYIIENNFDDFASERMSKPFQGIKENQSFSLDCDSIGIILDEKNDEFINGNYYEYIRIPLSYFGDDFYIFDKYYDENKNLFETEKLTKKLLPNQLEFKVNNMIEEGNERYFISVVEGEFINVPNQDIEEKLNEMVKFTYDIESYKERVKTITAVNQSSHLGHYVNVFTNAGGYLSTIVSEEIYFDRKYELKITPFNYDFNLNKEMLLKDIFVDGMDINKVLKNHIKKMNYPITEEMIEEGVAEFIKANDFYFDEYGVSVYFSPEGAKLDTHQKWVWVPFEEFGIENIKLFK